MVKKGCRPVVWFFFTETGELTQVHVNGKELGMENVLVIEFDPYTIYRTVLVMEDPESMGIPPTLIDSFTLVGKIPIHDVPGLDQPFARLLPYLRLGRVKKRVETKSGSKAEGVWVKWTRILQKSKEPLEWTLKKCMEKSNGINQIVIRVLLVWKVSILFTLQTMFFLSIKVWYN
jgi:hypothetical protein